MDRLVFTCVVRYFLGSLGDIKNLIETNSWDIFKTLTSQRSTIFNGCDILYTDVLFLFELGTDLWVKETK